MSPPGTVASRTHRVPEREGGCADGRNRPPRGGDRLPRVAGDRDAASCVVSDVRAPTRRCAVTRAGTPRRHPRGQRPVGVRKPRREASAWRAPCAVPEPRGLAEGASAAPRGFAGGSGHLGGTGRRHWTLLSVTLVFGTVCSGARQPGGGEGCASPRGPLAHPEPLGGSKAAAWAASEVDVSLLLPRGGTERRRSQLGTLLAAWTHGGGRPAAWRWEVLSGEWPPGRTALPVTCRGRPAAPQGAVRALSASELPPTRVGWASRNPAPPQSAESPGVPAGRDGPEPTVTFRRHKDRRSRRHGRRGC